MYTFFSLMFYYVKKFSHKVFEKLLFRPRTYSSLQKDLLIISCHNNEIIYGLVCG